MTSIAEKIHAMDPKKKQYLVLLAVGTVFSALVLGSVALIDDQQSAIPAPPPVQQQAKSIAIPGEQVDPKDVWIAQSTDQMRQMTDTLSEMRQRMQELEKQKAPASPSESLLPPLPSPQQLAAPLLPPPTAPVPVDTTPVPPPEPKVPGIAVFEVSNAAQEADEAGKGGKDGKVKAKTSIPAGSFMRVAILAGIDAPTGGQAQNNPWPVLLRVQENAFLPNRFRAKVKSCHILGQAYGDLSSERANIRAETFSCVLNTGQTIETSMKGFAVGEDGKAGIRGRVITKQGQVLANALTTGVLAGIGQGFAQSAMQYNSTPFGTVGQVDPGQRITAGVGVGVGKALDRLSQYYISLAEKMFPVIEVDAARQIDIVLSKGLTLALEESTDAAGDGDYSEYWKRGRRIMGLPLEP